MSLTTRNLPSADNRPATAAEQVANRAARIKADAAKPLFCLATATAIVKFVVDADAGTVTIHRTVGDFLRRSTVSTEQARKEYQHLLASGYSAW